jgi:hypothetical protein
MSEIEIHERLAVLETKIDSLSEDLHTLMAYEKRISALERWRAYLLGAGAFLGAASAWLAHLLSG